MALGGLGSIGKHCKEGEWGAAKKTRGMDKRDGEPNERQSQNEI